MDQITALLNEAVKQVKDLPHFNFRERIEAAKNLSVKDKVKSLQWYDRRHNNSFHEPATIAAIHFMQQRYNGGLFFDVGAHWGYFSIKAKCMDVRTACIAIEPSDGAQERMKAINKGEISHGVNALVSDIDAIQPVWANQFDWYESLDELPDRAHRHGLRGDKTGVRVDNVRIARLDTIAKAFGAPDYLKIDVEGHQTKAILGMGDLLNKSSVIIELHDPDKLSVFNTTNEETVTPLFEAGYSGWWCGNHRDMDAVFEPFNKITEDKDRLSLAVFTKEASD
jgi:FkbM family methyltransferase